MNPLPDDERAEAIAKSICADCVFIEPCKEWGMKHNDVGVFGGLTQQERLTIKRKVGRERRRHNGMQGSRQ